MVLFQEVILSNIFPANKSSVGNANCLSTMDKSKGVRSKVTPLIPEVKVMTLIPKVKVKGHGLSPEVKVKGHDLDSKVKGCGQGHLR